MVESMKRVAAGRALGQVTVDVDPFVESMVRGWPTHLSDERALKLGIPEAHGLDDVIQAYMDDYLDPE
jgi:hypothetical protein